MFSPVDICIPGPDFFLPSSLFLKLRSLFFRRNDEISYYLLMPILLFLTKLAAINENNTICYDAVKRMLAQKYSGCMSRNERVQCSNGPPILRLKGQTSQK